MYQIQEYPLNWPRHRTKCINFFYDEYIKEIKHWKFFANSGAKFVTFLVNVFGNCVSIIRFVRKLMMHTQLPKTFTEERVKFVPGWRWKNLVFYFYNIFIYLTDVAVLKIKCMFFFKIPTFRLILWNDEMNIKSALGLKLDVQQNFNQMYHMCLSS